MTTKEEKAGSAEDRRILAEFERMSPEALTEHMTDLLMKNSIEPGLEFVLTGLPKEAQKGILRAVVQRLSLKLDAMSSMDETLAAAVAKALDE